MLARWPRRQPPDDDLEESDDAPSETLSGPPVEQQDPLAVLAAAAGYDDPERWWDDLVESRLDSSSPFPLITDAMAELRMIMDQGRDAEREARREAYMRQKIREALKRGRERVAVVCGAWHAPVLRWPLPPAAADVRTLRGAPRRKITLTWVPWTISGLPRQPATGPASPRLVGTTISGSLQIGRSCAGLPRSRRPARPRPSGVQRPRHRGCPARGNLGQLAWQTAGRSGGGHRGDSGSAV